jgi:hypothetical protein
VNAGKADGNIGSIITSILKDLTDALKEVINPIKLLADSAKQAVQFWTAADDAISYPQ